MTQSQGSPHCSPHFPRALGVVHGMACWIPRDPGSESTAPFLTTLMESKPVPNPKDSGEAWYIGLDTYMLCKQEMVKALGGEK